MIKSISLDEFLEAMKEGNTDSIEQLFEKLKSEPITQENKIEKVKEVLHKEIDNLKTEKDFERFALKIAESVLEHYRDKVIGDK